MCRWNLAGIEERRAATRRRARVGIDVHLRCSGSTRSQMPGAWLEVPESAAPRDRRGQRPSRSPPPGTTANRKRPVGREVYAYGEGRGQVT